MNLFRVAIKIAEDPPHVDSFELGESAGMMMRNDGKIEEVTKRIKEALLSDDEIPYEDEFDKGFWYGIAPPGASEYDDDYWPTQRNEIKAVLKQIKKDLAFTHP